MSHRNLMAALMVRAEQPAVALNNPPLTAGGVVAAP